MSYPEVSTKAGSFFNFGTAASGRGSKEPCEHDNEIVAPLKV
jgi:hypothetical protein